MQTHAQVVRAAERERAMSAGHYDGLTAIAALRKHLGSAQRLEAIHENGYLWTAEFEFGEPADDTAIVGIEAELGLRLPTAYRRFLTHYDGALLYKDAQYGQWGIRLYGIAILLAANAKWRQTYGAAWPVSYVAFGETLGDADVLVLDTAMLVDEGHDCAVIDGDRGDRLVDWEAAAPRFGDWLDRLVVAQGAKYWRWR